MKYLRQIILMGVTLCVVASALACLGISDSEHEEALATQVAVYRAQVDDLVRGQEERVNDLGAEVADAESRAAEIEDANVRLAAERDSARTEVEMLDAAASRLRHDVEDARRETRWLSYDATGNDGSPYRMVAGWDVDLQGSDLPLMMGLVAICANDGNFLYLWDQLLWEDETEYDAKVGFDDERPRAESIWGFGTVLGNFVDLSGDDLWEVEEVVVIVATDDGGRRSTTFDTPQLLRMFPTAGSFCRGDDPAGY